MKNYLLLLLIFPIAVIAQKKKKQYWLDENGKSITEDAFYSEWRKDDSEYARWDCVAKDSVKVSKFSHQKFETYQVAYSLFLNYFKELTGTTYPDTTIFLIEYKYLNDYCEGNPSNNWSFERINIRANYTDNKKEEIKKIDKNIVYLVVFEEGFKFKQTQKSKEYYFSDKNNFLRKSIFINPSFCGSFMVIKPDGNTLVRNGEFNATMMTEYLKPKNWNVIFKL